MEIANRAIIAADSFDVDSFLWRLCSSPGYCPILAIWRQINRLAIGMI